MTICKVCEDELEQRAENERRSFVFRECEVVYRIRDVAGMPIGLNARIKCSEDVYRIMGPLLRDQAVESMWILLLDARQRVNALHEAAKGGVHHVVSTPSDMLRAAIIAHASAIILVHNHPSGVAEPSAEDLAVTEQVCNAGTLLGISVLDHVIIAGDGFYSLLDSGQLRHFK